MITHYSIIITNTRKGAVTLSGNRNAACLLSNVPSSTELSGSDRDEGLNARQF